MDFINRMVLNHVLASHGVVAATAIALARIDDVILFLLRFFDAETIKAELDRLDALAKARIDRDSAQSPKP